MTKNPNAVALGSIRSAKKAAASVANGKLGGRPSAAMEKLSLLLYFNDPKKINGESTRSRYFDRALIYHMRNHAYRQWLSVATPSHIRKHWRKWMGPRPEWAFIKMTGVRHVIKSNKGKQHGA